MATSIRRVGTLALALLLVSACSVDRAAAPTTLKAPSDEASQSLLGTIGTVVGTVTTTLHLTTANGVLRSEPLANSITVKAKIDKDGGVLRIPAAGVTVLIPRGALKQSTVITMTARAGSLLAYDFEPHGITFSKPLVFTQDLHGTTVSILQVPFLQLGYYSDPSLLGATTAVVSELLGGLGDVLTWTFTAPIKHFSGYVILCGRE